jgi:adenosylmethionine-8-amino-7-oxononanoate aminotransferase
MLERESWMNMAFVDQERLLSQCTKEKDFEDNRAAKVTITNGSDQSAVLYSRLDDPPPKAISSKGCWITTEDGLEIFDASSGAAVACLGHNDSRVNAAIIKQLEKIAYCYAPFLTSQPVEQLAWELSKSTGHRLPKVFIVSSGEFNSSANYRGR